MFCEIPHNGLLSAVCKGFTLRWKGEKHLKLMDVGKLDTLAEADAFVKQLGY